jgi:hypothetical protein
MVEIAEGEDELGDGPPGDDNSKQTGGNKVGIGRPAQPIPKSVPHPCKVTGREARLWSSPKLSELDQGQGSKEGLKDR